MRLENFGAGTLETDADGNVSVSSDERLKTVLGEFDAGLSAILGLEPISYRWNESSGYETRTTYAGFSAQNVQENIPEAVGEDKRGFLTLSDRPILAAVVTAVQELWEMISLTSDALDSQSAEIADLEEAVAAQAIRIEALEAQLGDGLLVEEAAVETDAEPDDISTPSSPEENDAVPVADPDTVETVASSTTPAVATTTEETVAVQEAEEESALATSSGAVVNSTPEPEEPSEEEVDSEIIIEEEVSGAETEEPEEPAAADEVETESAENSPEVDETLE